MCSCLPPKPPCQAYGASSAVFVGLVTSVSIDRNNLVARFTLEQPFKGVEGTEAEVFTARSDAACGFRFASGNRYLVYAYRRSENESLSTNLCTRTCHLSYADEDLEYLNNRDKAAPGSTIYGTVKLYARDMGTMREVSRPMTGMTVVIEGQNNRFEIVTDGEGRYNIAGIPPGSYEIRAALPNHLSDPSEHKVEVFDRGCAEEDLYIRPDGRISGKVVDSEGRPASGMKIELISAEPPEEYVYRFGLWANADKEGRYEFKQVPPGRYLLGINIEYAPSGGRPYPRTYYPGVFDPREAQVIVLGEGTIMEGLDITLAPKLATRYIRGQVVWPDGSGAEGARVSYGFSPSDGKSESSHTKSYMDGRFAITALDGLIYLITALAGSLSTEQVKVKASANMEMIKLVLR